jgi:CRP/FNR family cyclic AMP-dependent transcriptional regulator
VIGSVDGGNWLPGTFLARLDAEASRDLLRLGRKRVLAAGESLTNQGDDNTHVFVLESRRPGTAACVKVTATTRNGSETLLGIRLAGDIIGEIAALRDGRRTATVTTCAETVVHAVTHDAFLGFLSAGPGRWEVLSRLLADRLHWANRRRLDFIGYDVRVRLARVMLELLERHGRRTELGVELGVQLSQEELGKLIGAKPDAVAVAMRHLRAEGLVTSRYRGVLITDVDELRVVADED